jgi:hypothetical protein
MLDLQTRMCIDLHRNLVAYLHAYCSQLRSAALKPKDADHNVSEIVNHIINPTLLMEPLLLT